MTRIHAPKTAFLLAVVLWQSCSQPDVKSPQQTINKITLVQGNIYTIAGTGKVGDSGDAGPALAATFSTPQGLSVDSLGNVYVVDSGNPVIRQILSNGSIATFAGVANDFGDSGDGGPASAANLGWLTDVAVDKSGSVYVADGASNVIRKVKASTGTITTLAGNFLGGYNIVDPLQYSGDGGPATSAHLNVPLALTVAKSGNVYIIDAGNNAIRKVVVSTGVITTIAGGIAFSGYSGDGGPAVLASIFNPYGIAVDGSENVYIAEMSNNVIRKITASTGMMSTVAGKGPNTSGFSGDGGRATAATLNGPKGVGVDESGNVYVADTENNVIRKITFATGTITTLAGSGPGSGYSGDGGPATSAKLNGPSRVAIDKSGVVYIADSENNVIRAVKQ